MAERIDKPAEAWSDGEVVAAVLSGDRERFAVLVDRYQGPLRRVAASRLGSSDWAEEVVQETFLCALRWLSTYDSRYSLRTWLWTILLNQCHRHHHRRRRDGARVDWLAVEATALASTEAPSERAIARERSAALERLLGELPEPQADALRLRFFGGLKFQEIADAMGCSLSSAKNRVRWGLATISQRLTAAELRLESDDL